MRRWARIVSSSRASLINTTRTTKGICMCVCVCMYVCGPLCIMTRSSLNDRRREREINIKRIRYCGAKRKKRTKQKVMKRSQFSSETFVARCVCECVVFKILSFALLREFKGIRLVSSIIFLPR